jgi:hypothetical protein
MQISVSHKELVVLEALDALGGDATSGRLRSLIRRQLRDQLFELLSALETRGLVSRYARASYVITSEGRHAVRMAEPMPLAG